MMRLKDLQSSAITDSHEKKNGAVIAFIITNGIILATIVFFFLNYFADVQRDVDAHNTAYSAVRTLEKFLGASPATITFQDIEGLTLRAEIERITVYDEVTGSLVLEKNTAAPSANTAPGFLGKFATYKVHKKFQVSNRLFNIECVVRISPDVLFLSVLPYVAAFIVLLLAAVVAVVVGRKRHREHEIENMNRSLAGAHKELKTKTTERDQLMYALKKSEREYKAVINSVSDVIFETDHTGKVMFLNETWRKITDQDIDSFAGKNFFDFLIVSDRDMQREMFFELVRGERQAYRTESILDLGPGKSRSVEIAFSMLRVAEDKSIRVVGTVTDIEKRRKAELALRDAEQRYRAIFENSISGIYQTSPAGRFMKANQALAEILGYDSVEELVLSVTDISLQVYVNPESRKEFIQKILFEGRISAFESEVYKKDGTKIWIAENARIVRSVRGGVEYYEGSIWDITEKKKAEDAMIQARLQAEISSRSRMEFLANMSHELRTPLNAIIGFSEIIKDEIVGPVGTKVYKEYAQDIFESGNHLLKIISEILEVSKIEAGQRELNRGSFSIERALKSCLTIMSPRIEQAEIEVNIGMPKSLPNIIAEELGFKQIMLNLISNAIKFTPKNGRIEVSASLDSYGRLVLDVHDTGVGMTEDEIKKAMQPFGRVDSSFSATKAGTGLGLTIVNSLVQLHGGEFKLMSQKGAGTTARVILPADCILQSSNVTPLRASKDA